VLSESSPEVPSWGLGHVRLAILDLSPAGLQPMASEDGRRWIVFNGEVYNHVELRQELEALGHRFDSTTDTEVILASYREWGDDCVTRFNGMFAFVLVDLDTARVFVARDRLGVKPLYLWRFPSGLAVVSEPKQLLEFPDFRPRINRLHAVDFLIDGVLDHEPDQCFFDGIEALSPGHTLSWPLDEPSRAVAARCYWEPQRGSRETSWRSAVEETGFLLRDAVRIRLRSDVPVGSCLSGGLDSSSIVGLVSRELGLRMNTFSSCFEDARFDERRYIHAVNRECKTVGHEVFPSVSALMEDLEKLAYHQDEPFTSSGIYAQWCVMEAARRNSVPVLLDGQGGDELLCGYRKYFFFHLRQLVAAGRYGAAAVHLMRMVLRGDKGLMNWQRGQRYLPAWLRKNRDAAAPLLMPEWRALARHAWSDAMTGVTSIHENQWADLRHWSLPSLLRYEDRNSMAHSIETRLPFLDYRLVEHCLSLRESFFFKEGRSKRLLVATVGDALPVEVRQRRTKMGFETPGEVWMRERLGEVLEKRVRTSERLACILDTTSAGDAFAAYRAGSRAWTDLFLFRVASLAVWLDTFKVDV